MGQTLLGRAAYGTFEGRAKPLSDGMVVISVLEMMGIIDRATECRFPSIRVCRYEQEVHLQHGCSKRRRIEGVSETFGTSVIVFLHVLYRRHEGMGASDGWKRWKTGGIQAIHITYDDFVFVSTLLHIQHC